MYANIIIDISHEMVDRPFQYRVPPNLQGEIQVGSQVQIPFGAGNHLRRGYVVDLTERAEFDIQKIKDIAGVAVHGVTAQTRLSSAPQVTRVLPNSAEKLSPPCWRASPVSGSKGETP